MEHIKSNFWFNKQKQQQTNYYYYYFITWSVERVECKEGFRNWMCADDVLVYDTFSFLASDWEIFENSSSGQMQ